MISLINSDCWTALKQMKANSVDAIVTDPPYGISFMNKKWDYDVPKVYVWYEALRILKPGGHLLCACGTRTQHRMAVNIEDAGFEIRDLIAWIYGSGFPKSLNLGNGFGTALKPAMELWTLARKPISEKTVVANVLKWGTGGINIDGCRVEWDKEGLEGDQNRRKTPRTDITGAQFHASCGGDNAGKYIGDTNLPQGRFPANVIHDGSEEVIGQFPVNAGAFAPVKSGQNGDSRGIYGDFAQKGDDGKSFHGDGIASASRFFYAAKASKSERNKGLEGFDEQFDSSRPWCSEESDRGRIATRLVSKQGKNNHPTVKPVSLMRYLCKLITPPHGIVLDPFMGSGTTGIGAKTEGFSFIGIEKEEEYCKIAQARIDAWVPEPKKETGPIQQKLF